MKNLIFAIMAVTSSYIVVPNAAEAADRGGTVGLSQTH